MLTNYSKILLSLCSAFPIIWGLLIGQATSWSELVCVLVFGILCIFIVKHLFQWHLRRLFVNDPLELRNIKSIVPHNNSVFLFTVIYVIPIVASGKIALIPAVGLVSVVFVSALFIKNVMINPIMLLLGYHIYDITDSENITHILFSKSDLPDLIHKKILFQRLDYISFIECKK